MAERVDPKGMTEIAPLGSAPSLPSLAEPPRSLIEEGPPLVAGRYQLLGLVGAGGMGTVYRAQDRELDEVVAFKVLKKELALADGMLDRFRREVKLARRVTHRNVARMYDIGDYGGDRFLTMEFIEGEGLAALLERRGTLMPGEAVAIANDLCAGLAAAHAANVLHRDLKPENVIIAHDGRAVITDFGIARATEADMSRTQGGIVGTPAYMAPEQVEGAADLDARVDLYALGTMLFELLTGRLPWEGHSIIAMATARLLRPPPDPRTYIPNLPARLAEIVLKLMARQREDRFASAPDAAQALRALSVYVTEEAPAPASAARVAGIAGHKKALVVLPVVNLGTADDAYLAMNLTEDLTDDLTTVPSLRVRPGGLTETFVDPKRDVREIGRSANVDVVVDASLRRIGELVRVSVRLVTVEDGFQLWAKRYDRAPTEVLAIAREAAQAVARALTAEAAHAQDALTTQDPYAADLFLRGRYLLRSGWFDAARDGRKLLAEAYRRAPDDTRIAGTYALSLAREFGNSAAGPDTMKDARRIAERALATDPLQSGARVCLALLSLYNGAPETAAKDLRRAIADAPNEVEALDGLARVQGEVGRLSDALGNFERALAISRDRPRIHYEMARLKTLAGDESGLELLPQAGGTSEMVALVFLRARVALWRSDRAAAAELADAFTAINVKSPMRDSMLGCLRIAARGTLAPGDAEAMKLALPVDESRPPRNAVFHAQLRTEIFLAAGALDEAAQSLLIAGERGLFDVLWLERCSALAVLRGTPEYARVRELTSERVKRVIAALDAPL